MAVLVGKTAPDFCANAVRGDRIIEEFRLHQFKDEKYVVLFFYPLDFTFVCPTELHAFSARLDEFSKRNVELVAVSVDSHYSHLAWLGTPKEKGGIQGVGYTIVSDLAKSIARDYDVLTADGTVAYRGLFLLDKSMVIRHQLVNDLPLGRSVDETVRMVDALQYYEQHGEVCPADWHRGDTSMTPTPAGLHEYFSSR